MSMGLRLFDRIRDQFELGRNGRGGNSRMARRLNEEQAAVNAGILDIAITLSGKLLPEVRRVLILDVLHNWVPAGGALAC